MLPAVLGCIGTGLTFGAVFINFMRYFRRDYRYDVRCFSDYINLFRVVENEDALLKFAGAMGFISGSIGYICSFYNILLSCQTLPAKIVRILGTIYIALGVMSLLMLVALASETCSAVADDRFSVCPAGCKLSVGGTLAIVAFFVYIGAGLSTFYLNRTRTGRGAGAEI